MRARAAVVRRFANAVLLAGAASHVRGDAGQRRMIGAGLDALVTARLRASPTATAVAATRADRRPRHRPTSSSNAVLSILAARRHHLLDLRGHDLRDALDEPAARDGARGAAAGGDHRRADGCGNRRFLEQVMDRELQRHAASAPLSLLALGTDRLEVTIRSATPSVSARSRACLRRHPSTRCVIRCRGHELLATGNTSPRTLHGNLTLPGASCDAS